ncbi:transcriptional regulator, ArgR family [Syntrophobotulus glycolicus DSM 8271]|uniref:Arginine repressor n=1 Tax=Syntrophobotulus glycolicus (strain DSM 8271 / FlGlyR) TaxID=645991 RepID=F0T092_SYNGF|nr:arginine repressor [Syntrophobotulus glycolicus]ADY56179.1 transcriptional regulator, ArgR family [Syntrophobotulus glycolicus DSM 8271]
MKTRRQAKIQELITNELIRTQEELAERLTQEGFQVTQATISRDIKEMGLVKIPINNEDYRYSVSGEVHPTSYHDRLKRMFKEVVTAYDFSENLVVVRTIPGNAQALALLLDNVNWKEIIGSVAGDDTIILVVKPIENITEIMDRLTKLQK